MSEHDEHSSFIKTPQQLIVVLLLSFLVPIIGIVLLVQLVLGKPTADPAALTPESVAARIQPAGRIEFGSATPVGPRVQKGGEEVYKAVCMTCHQAGVANAPKFGDKAAWKRLISEGQARLVRESISGIRAMPPRGGNPDLSDLEVERAVVYMVNNAGGKFKDPAAAPAAQASAPAPAVATATAATPAASAAAAAAAPDGKKLYDTTCFACHAQSVAGSPKLGDKAAWAPRIKTGVDAMLKTVVTGKGAMPPKGGNVGLSEAEIRAAVEYMASQSR